MKIHHLTVQEALKSLQSGVDGLSGLEARRRFMEFGPNQVERVKKEPLAFQFLRGFTHFFALILWVAAGLAFFAEWNDPGKGMAALGLAILGVILVNALFSFTQEFRAERAISALQKLLPHLVKALRDRKVVQIPAAELVPGDLILLEQGDNIPADCRLVQGFGVRVNNATITGESLPKARDEHPSTEEDLTQSKNVLLAGTSLVSGETKALVFATGMHTEFGKIAHLTQTAGEALSPLQKEVILLSRMVALLATALGVIFFFIGRALGLSFWENFIFAIGIIVANVPEGLLPTLTLALAMGSQRMARRNALIRHLPSVETLGSATVICTDKTGTLTQNRMAVKRIYLSDHLYHPAELYQDAHLKEDYRFFFEVALFCQDLKTVVKQGREELLGDPMELSLVEMAKKVIPGVEEYPRVDEIPFDSDRKRLSTLHNTPRGLMLYTKGALEMLLPLCHQVQMGVEVRPLTSGLKEQFLKAQESMAEEGLRVLAFAHRAIPEGYDLLRLEENLILSALVGLEDPPRPEVPDAIKDCKGAGIRIIMVTGDNPDTARAVGRETGMFNDPEIVTGAELRGMHHKEILNCLRMDEIMFARVTPSDKMTIVSALKDLGEVVAVTGDGVNDAPALKRADIGIAMGLSGTDVAKEAADIVLLDDNFATIVRAIEEGRAVFENIKKFTTYILSSNIPEIIPYIAYMILGIPLPLTVVQILAVDLGTDMLPALALGAEPPEPGILKRPPRSVRQRLLSLPLLARAYLFLGPIEAIAAMAGFFWFLSINGWQWGDQLASGDPLYLQATTVCLTGIIVMQIANVFVCRSGILSAFSISLWINKFLLAGIAVELLIILFIVYTPQGNILFGTGPIPLTAWAFFIPFALFLLGFEELRKKLVRKMTPIYNS